MKNKKLIMPVIILLLTNSFLATSQVLKGEIIYTQQIVDNIIDSIYIKKKNKSISNVLGYINQTLNNYNNEFEFKLTFNQNESIYKMVNKLEKDDDKSYQIAVALSRGRDINYINLKTKEILVKERAYGKLFIVKSDLNHIKWKLHNETKKIDKYTCYKATTVKIVKNSKGTFRKTVIAWYAPKIPLNYGPKGYGNLPGLILELQEGKFKYHVTKLTLNPKKKITIQKPTKGKFVTLQEFDSLSNKLSKSFWDNK